MKKTLISLFVLVLSMNIVSATGITPLKEEKLDLRTFTPDELRQVKKEVELKEKRQLELQEEGEDYMYRMRQQMMQPQGQGWNSFGGYRY